MAVNRKKKERVVITGLRPQIDCGAFPVKRIRGDEMEVSADVICDGHDLAASVLLYKRKCQRRWSEAPMTPGGNDLYLGCFNLNCTGRYFYTVKAWLDKYATWMEDLEKKLAAGQDISEDLAGGERFFHDALSNAEGVDRKVLKSYLDTVRGQAPAREKYDTISSRHALALVRGYLPRYFLTGYDRVLEIDVSREKAGCSTWYEFFPRSCPGKEKKHGTFKDCAGFLEYIADMGFDTVYLPPIHPAGRTHRKGKNNRMPAGPDEPGSPWAIGSESGGHKSIDPRLGTMKDFLEFTGRAAELGLEVALDLAYQCTPEHPYVKEHPEWFSRRQDGTIKFAENPPKKYEDIYPFDFETDDFRALWDELYGIAAFWIEKGIKIFRVDNPHTKPFSFWKWLIERIKKKHPEVIMLSEAFTRPKVMYHLAKTGFDQSYTYFTWRNTKQEIVQYFDELYNTEVREYFRPSLWPNTPDILSAYLQRGGRPAFMTRLILAATLSANYGIYGPAFELCENMPREPGSEEYLDSEKYEIRDWDIYSEGSIRKLIKKVNHIRRSQKALRSDAGLHFHHIGNDQIVCYSRHDRDNGNILIIAVNLDPVYRQSGWTGLDMEYLDIPGDHRFIVHDLLTGIEYEWSGNRNYIELDPGTLPAHIFLLKRPRIGR
jgi:starch synthase (maltosyl-transferring)